MKERDFDREEMAAHTILYQKNLNQVNFVFVRFFILGNRREINVDKIVCVCIKCVTPERNVSPVFTKKSPSPEGEQIGRWADYIKQRIVLEDLKREFNGWTGNHERHCILHDVFLT